MKNLPNLNGHSKPFFLKYESYNLQFLNDFYIKHKFEFHYNVGKSRIIKKNFYFEFQAISGHVDQI